MFVYGLHPPGDVGVICVPGSLRVLLLLPPSRHRFMCIANWDNWPRPAGVQSPRVGPGDGGPGLLSWLRQNPSVQLRVAGLRTRRLECNWERWPQWGKEARKARPAFCVHLQSHPKTLQFMHHSGFKEPGSTVLYVITIVFDHHCCHNLRLNNCTRGDCKRTNNLHECKIEKMKGGRRVKHSWTSENSNTLSKVFKSCFSKAREAKDNCVM